MMSLGVLKEQREGSRKDQVLGQRIGLEITILL
jgi:hypothetical protein